MTSHTLDKPSLRSMLAGLITHVTCCRLPEPVSLGWIASSRHFDVQVETFDGFADLLAWADSLHEATARLRRMPYGNPHLTVAGQLIDGSSARIFAGAPNWLAAQYAEDITEHGECPVTLAELRNHTP